MDRIKVKAGVFKFMSFLSETSDTVNKSYNKAPKSSVLAI